MTRSCLSGDPENVKLTEDDQMQDSQFPVLIIGGGAAGSTCAMFLGRAGIGSVVLDRGASTLQRAWLHNLPGTEPVLGQDWLRTIQASATATQLVTFTKARVASIASAESHFTVTSDAGEHAGPYLVLATGQGPLDYSRELRLATAEPLQPHVKVNVVVDRWGETSCPRVFACGVLAGWPSQAVICAGSGANVAIAIASKVKGTFWVDHDTAPLERQND